jgi:hypothetical protein
MSDIGDRLTMYSDTDLQLFVKAKESTGQVVKGLKELAGSTNITSQQIQELLAKTTAAALSVRLLAAALEDNRRMLAQEREYLEG